MKGDKYCYEIIQHQIAPSGFTAGAIAESHNRIKTLRDAEKMTRRGEREVAQSDLRGTLTQQFERDVKGAQTLAKKTIKGLINTFPTRANT